MNESIVHVHCNYVQDRIIAGDLSPIMCLNYLQKYASDRRTRDDWYWIGLTLVMRGSLKLNDDNDFVVKG